MLQSRKNTVSRSIFYRGISLKQYLKKSSRVHQPLEYKDDQTIFVDQQENPILIDSSFIFVEPNFHHAQPKVPTPNFKELTTPVNNLYLPSLGAGKVLNSNIKSSITERNSTDTSLPNEADVNCNLLPGIERKRMIRQRNITMASRSSSRSVSCRKKLSNIIIQVKQFQEEELSPTKMGNIRLSVDSKNQKLMKKNQNLRTYSKFKSKCIKLKYADLPKPFGL